ncbi:MAG TPA: filamentous hemagglutinin N-terminal domain-containing protein [Acetobacteraceae bacterium]
MAKAQRKHDVKLLGVVRRKRAALLVSTALCVTFVMVVSMPGQAQAQPAPNARPTGGVVTAGSAAISQSTNETTINQSTNRAAVNWQSFDVGSQQEVQFNQPSTSSVTLNRVVGPNPSQIAGQINANGQVVLVNQSGVVFYKGSQVNTAGLMVSAAGISNQNFMAGKMVFDQAAAPNAEIVNQGNITIKQAGLAALVAPQVVNSGVIDARLGHVVLAGASKATLDLYGDGMLSVDVTGSVTQAPNGATALVTNTGVIRASGGTVQLTARAVDGIVTNLVDAGGTISAASVGGKTGSIALNGIGGSIIVDGQLSATGNKPGTTGGDIVANATGNVVVTSKARVDASGQAGGGTVAIGTTLARAKGSPSVTAKHTAANVLVQQGATIAANATASGNGGRVTILSTNNTIMDGAIAATGGPLGGDGGFAEVSGGNLALNGAVDLTAPNGATGTLLLDPDNLTIVHSNSKDGSLDATLDNNDQIVYSDDSGGTDTVTDKEINSLNANILLQAVDTLTLNAGAPLTLGNNKSLTLETKTGDITIGSSITASGTGNIIILAGTNAASGGTLTLNADLITDNKGGVTLQADGGISLNANITTNVLDVSNITSGGVTQASGETITAATLQSANGVAGTADFAGTANAIASVGSIAVSGGDFTLVNTGSLDLAGKLTATNISVGSDTISASGSVGATTDLALAAGAGGISLNTGHILSGATVDLSATNGGVAQVATGTISATTSLQSGSGVKGAVDLAGTSNAISAIGSFAVSSGDFTLADTGNLTAAGKLTAANITLNSPTITATGSVGATTTLALVAGSGGIALNTGHILSAATVDLSATGGGVTQVAGGTITATTVLQSTSNIAGGLTLVSTVNQIAKLGAIKVTSGNIAIVDAAALTIGGLVNAAAGNVYLESSNATGITFGASQTVEAVSGDTIGLQTNALVNIGTAGATGVINAGAGGTFELSPDTANAVTLGSHSGLSLTNLTGITAGLVRIGAVTQPSGLSPTIIANAISIDGAFGSSSTNLELDTTGTVKQTAALTASTLTGNVNSGTLTTAGNAIATLGNFAVANDFSLTDTGSLAVAGTVTTANIVLNAPTIGVSGSIGATTSLTVTTTTGALALTGSALLNGGTVDLASNTNIAEPSTATISATSFTASAGSGSIVLNGTSNAIGTVTGLSATVGGVTLIVDPTTVLTGPITGENLFFEVAHAGDTLQVGNATTGATLTATAAANPTISFVADNVTEGTAASTIAATDGANLGTVEIAPFTSARPISFGGASAPSGTLLVDTTLLGDISTGTGGGLLRIGNFTGGSITAGNISFDGAVNLGAAVASTLEVDSAGSISEIASIALTVGTLTGTASSSVALLGTSDSIGTLGSFAAGTGAFTLVDNGNTGNLSVTGPVTGSNVTISDANTGTISVSGSIGATTSLVLAAGKGGIALSASEILSGATVDLSAANGGVTQAAGGTISATTILQSTSGVTGTVDLIGTANTIASVGAFAVTSGDFTLVGTGSVGLAGLLTATNISVSVPTITATGSIGATTDLVLSAGGGGIALNSGHILTGATVDLSASGGGVTQTAAGTISATVLQSTSKVAGGVALLNNTNTITDLGPLKATSGNISIADTHALTIAGGVTASAGNIYLRDSAAGGIIFDAFTVASQSGGTVGLQTDALTNLGTTTSTGAIDAGSSGVFELAPNTQGNAETLGSASGLSLTNLTGITAGTLRVGAVTVPGSGLTTMAGSIAVTGAAFDGTGLTKLELDATTSGGGTGDVGQSTALLNIATLTGTAASYTLTDTSNTIGAVGPLSATSGNIAISDATAMTIAGSVAATAGNVYLEDSAAGGITFGAFAVSSQAGRSIGLQTNALVNLGTTAATGVVNAGSAGTFELSPDTANAMTLGASSGLSLSNLTNITAGLVRVGAVTQPGNGSPTTIANAISIAGTFGSSSTSLELDATGAVAQSAALTAATLSGTATSYTLTTASNAIGTLGPLTASGTIAIDDATALHVGGAVQSTGGNVYLEDSAGGGITFGGFTITSQTGGVIGLQTNALVNLGTTSATGAVDAGAAGIFELAPDTAHAVTLGASSGLSLANLTGITAGALRIGAVRQPGNASPTTIANAVSIAGAFGSGTVNLELDATGAVTQSAALTAAVLTGSATGYTLTTAANAIGTLGPLTATPGNIEIKDTSALTIGGLVKATAGNVYVESAGGITFGASQSIVAQNAGTIGLQTSTLTNLGTTLATGVVAGNGGPLAIFELSPDTANVVTLGSTPAGGLSLANLTGITTAALRVGAVTQPGNMSPTIIANAVSITGAFGSGTINLELDTTAAGAITQTAVLTAQTLTGTAGSGTLTLSNVIATLGGFSTTNNFSLTDAGSLAVAGTVTAANVVLNAATIGVGSSIGATTSLALVAGAGGIALNSGEILSGATVDFSATGGGVTQVAGGTIAATTVLQSTSGVTGTVDLIGTANTVASVGSFTVNSGDFTLVDTGDLTAAGKLTATNISLSSPTITATGSVGATSLLTLVGGAGGIALNTGEVITGTTVDLSATGAVSQVATGSIGATVLQSTGGVANGMTLAGTNNTIGTLAAITASTGNIDVVDAAPGSLVVNGSLTATSGSIYLNETQSGTIDFTATGSAIAASGIVGVQADAFSFTTGFSIAATTFELAPNSNMAVTLGGGTGLSGLGGIMAGTVRIGAITPITGGAPTTTATSIAIDGAFDLNNSNLDLRASGAVTQTAALTNVGTLFGSAGSVTLTTIGNTITNLGTFAATTSFALTDTGNLTVSGPVTGADIALSSATITSTGSIGATTTALLDATGGSIVLNSGAILSAATVDLSATGNVTHAAVPGGITATAVLQSTSGVAGTVDILGTSNTIASIGSFAAGGDFDLNDATSLVAAGKLTAQNIALTSPTITATGSVGATTTASLDATSGPILLNAGEILSGTTVDLAATGGVTQVAGGVISAGTLIGLGVTGTVDLAGTANAIVSVGSFAVTGGDFTLLDTGNLTAAGTLTANNVSLTSATITATGSIGATAAGGEALLDATGGAIALNSGVLSGATVDLSATSGVTQVASDIVNASTVLQSTSGVTGTVDLISAVNTILSVGSFAVTSGDFTLMDTGNLTAAGKLTANNISLTSPTITATGSVGATAVGGVALLHATGGAITLNSGMLSGPTVDLSATGGVTQLAGDIINATTVLQSTSGVTGTVDLAGTANAIVSVGSFAVTGGDFTLLDTGNLTAAGTLTANNISLTSATITATGSVGATAVGGVALLHATGGAIALNSGMLSGATVDLSATSGVTQIAGDIINASTVLQSTSGVTGTVDLISTVNTILSVGSFAVTGGDFTLMDTGNLTAAGRLTANNISLTSPTITATGSVGATGVGGVALLDATGGSIALNSGVLSGATVDLSATTGVTQVAGDIINATTVLQSTSGVTGTVDLVGTANTIVSVGSFAVTSGDFTLMDTGDLTTTGKLTATNISLTSPTIAATGSVGASGVLTVASGAGGIGLNTGAVLTGPTIDLNGSSGGIALTGNASLGSSGALVDVTTTGGMTEAATSTVTAATLRSTSGVTGTVALAGTANAVANLGNFPVTGGDFTLVDTGSLAVPGTVTANNITLSTNSTNQISATGSLGAATLVAVTSGSGGIGLNTGAVLTGPTIDLNGNGGPVTLAAGSQLGQTGDIVDVSTSGGGVNENAAATIIAATLRSALGVTGTVDLVGTANTIVSVGSFAVIGGDFTLMDSGDLTAAGKLTATNISLTSPTIAATGSVGASGVLTVASGAGGIGLNTGAVLTGPTIDLNGGSGGIALTGDASLGNSGALVDVTTTGGITEAITGTVTAGTLQSTSGVTGTVDLAGVANAVASLGNFPVASGNFTLVDTGSLAVPGTVTATNITLSTNTTNQISATGSLGAGTLVAVTSGSGGIALNTGAVLTGPTIDLNGNGGPVTLSAGSQLGQTGDIVDISTSAGGVNENAAATITAATLRSSLGVTGTVDLAGVANAVVSLANFVVTTGDFTLADTGSLAVPGTVTANNITLSTNGASQISATGSLGAGTLVALTSGSGGIALNTGAVLTGPTIDVNGNGGPITLAAGAQLGQTGDIVDISTSAGGVNENAAATITAATLRSSLGVTGTVDLAGVANAVASLSNFAVTSGNFILVDTGSLAVPGTVTANNITLSTNSTNQISATGSLGGGTVVAVTSGSGGIVLGTGAVVTAPTIDLNGNGGAIALTGNASVGTSTTLVDLTTTAGGVNEAATSVLNAATLQSAAGVTGSVALLGTANAVGNVGTFAVNLGDFTLIDTGMVVLRGPVSAGNVTVSATLGGSGVGVAGSVTANGTIAFTSGTGGIVLGNGAVVSAPTIDVNSGGAQFTMIDNALLGNSGALIDITTSGGGISELATAVITATTLQSTSGLTGDVNLLGSSNAIVHLAKFIITSGSLDLVDTGSLALGGEISATSVTANTVGSGAITASGSVTATGTMSLTSGTGGIGFGTGAVVSAPTIDLIGGGGAIVLTGNASLGNSGATINANTTAGGMSEAATSIINAATLLSGSGVTGNVSLLGTANTVANVAGFTVTAGNFTLVDTGSLGVSGPLNATNVTLSTTGGGTIAASGAITGSGSVAVTSGTGGISLGAGAIVTAPTIDLNGGGGAIVLTGNAVLNGATRVDLTTSGGGVSELASSSIDTALLQSAAGVNGNVTLSGSANAVLGLGMFGVTGGNFALVDTGSLAIAGPVSAVNVTASTSGAGAISASGSVTATNTLALTSGTGGIALGAGAVLDAPTIDLNGGGGMIALTGNAVLGTSNVTALIDLTTSNGGISEAGTSQVLTATLQSTDGVTGTATFAGTGNAIGTLANFIVSGGDLSLLDMANLSVTGPVQANNVTLTGTGATAISVSGTLGAVAGGGTLSVTSGTGGIGLGSGAVLGGSVIVLNGNGGAVTLSGDATVGGGSTTLDLDTTGGGVNETAGASMTAATLYSSLGVTGSVALAGSGNAITSLGSLAVTGGSFALTDTGDLAFNGPVSASSVSASTNGGGGIGVNTTVTASATPGGVLTLVSGTGGIDINTGGVLTGPTVDLSTTGGGITESGGGNIVATTLQSSGGVNGPVSLPVTTVGTIGSFVVAPGSGAFSMTDSTAITVAGRLSADSVALTDAGNISIPGVLADPANGTVELISTGGSITETGTLIAALLTGSSAGGTNLSGTGYANDVSTLGNFVANSGTFTLHDGARLLISGTITAGTIIINDDNGTGEVMLANGAGFVTGGQTRPSNGTIMFQNLPNSDSGVGGAYLTVGNFVQEGGSFVTPLNGTAAILDIDASGNISFDAGSGLNAPATWLVLNLIGGQATGVIDVQELDISYVAPTASSALTAEIDGFSGNAAAGRAFIVPEPDANFRVNACPVHSINCVLLPTQSLPTGSPLNDFFVGSMFSPADQGDLLLPIVSNEYMESLTAGFGTNPIQEDCDKDRSQPACKE